MEGGSSAASNTNTTTGSSDVLKRKSNDVGWEYGELVNPANFDKVKCKLCNKTCSGGIYRLKHHVAGIAGNITACPKASPLDKQRCKDALEGTKKKKQVRKEHIEEIREEVQIVEDDDCAEISGPTKKPSKMHGPMDCHTSKINPESTMEARKKMRQQNIHDALFRNKTLEVHAYLARWIYEAGVPFHAINNDSFHRFCEAVGQFGPGYLPPSQYQLREPLLEQEVERTKESMKKQKQEWEKSGCSIMTDAWTDRKRRSIMNICVNCKIGTSFLSSVEDSNEVHTGQYIFDYVDKHIEEVGAKTVVQVVTDNASNNMAAAKLLKEKRPNIFWTSCATHTLNLILEGIGKLPKFKAVIDKAKALTIFIYAHHRTLALMRKFTKKRDIVRPGVTRFASSFLTLQSILEKKEKLKFMFLSEEWGKCQWSTTVKGQRAYATIVSQNFWNGVSMCVDVFKPLVKALRLVDGDWKPSMGFIVGEINDAKKEIMKVCKDHEGTYKPILDIIDAKAKDRLDSPLHLTSYLLNPYFYYRDGEVEKDPRCMDAIMTCVESFFPDDYETQNVVSNIELLKYKSCSGIFARRLAIMGREKNDDNFDPVGWWSNYGVETPNLRMMAMRILSLTSSSSGCERNWSTFEGIHTKKRNRLDAERLNNLVFVQFNAKLLNKKKKMNEKSDVLLASEASMAQGWIVEGGDEDDDEEVHPGSGITWETISSATGADEFLQPRRSVRTQIRQLDEDDFKSDDEIVEEEITFDDSDEEHW